MLTHYLQLTVNLFTFALGGFIFWTSTGTGNIFDASYLEYGQALFGIFLMCATSYVAFYPCEHRDILAEESVTSPQNDVPTQ